MTNVIRGGLHQVVGIDLGTTYSAVATYDWTNDTAEVMRTETDEETVPSVVGWDAANERVIVGDVAKRNMAANPGATIFEIKREMGALFSEKTLDKYDPDRKSGAKVGEFVRVRFREEWLRPQEISAFTLMRMKEIAEASIGHGVLDAVITVPAYFTEKQRKATEEAARLAGLYPRQLVPEPTAAAICYGLEKFETTRKVYMVYDLGGGTFDVSIIAVQEERIEVMATAGDPRLGGGDFDDAITTWAVKKLAEEHSLDITRDRGAREIVKFHAERLKKQLSTFTEAEMSLLELRPSRPPVMKLTRAEFETMILPLVRKSLNYIDVALHAAETQKSIAREQIDGVLLVGGSSKIPFIRGLILDHFNRGDDFVKSDVHPDLAVARGAAMLARRFEPSAPPFDVNRDVGKLKISSDIEDEIFLIAEHSLGIAVNDDDFAKVVPQGTQLPVAIVKQGFTNGGPFTHVPVKVFQGEGAKVYENELIGVVPLGPMEPRPAGEHEFEVTFSLDKSGLLSTVVHHINEGQRYAAVFDHPTGVGGKEAMEIACKHLLSLWGDRSRPAPGPFVPPDPGPVPSPVPSPGPTPAPVSQVPEPVAPEPVPAPMAAQAAPAPNGMVREPRSEPPDQFKSIMRRARKQLLKQENPPLLEAYLRFVDALDRGLIGADLEEFGDAMDDAYLDARG